MRSKHRFLGIIPARYASTRFPGKPLADIFGKPMIHRVYEQVSGVLDAVYVATDDHRIYDTVKAFGGKVVMTSSEHKSGTDRCTEAADSAEKDTNTRFDVVFNVQGDEPFIDPRQMEILKSCFDDDKTQIATLVREIDSPNDLFNENRPKVVLNLRNEAIYFSRSTIPFQRGISREQWLRHRKYYMHVGLYAFRRDILPKITSLPQSPLELSESLEQLRWLENGYTISVRITDVDSFGIDTPEDLLNIPEIFRKGS